MNRRMMSGLMLGVALAVTGVGTPAEKETVLTLGACVKIALEHQPDLVAASNMVNAEEAKLGQARSAYYPQVNWSAGYSHVAPFPFGGLSGSGTGGLTMGAYHQYNTNLTLTQNIYDYGRTKGSVAARTAGLEASVGDRESAANQIACGAKEAYFGVLKAQRDLVIAKDMVEQFHLHLERTKAFFAVGRRPKFDVTKAEVDVSNAKLALIRAENGLKLGRVGLNNAMGTPDADDLPLEDVLDFVKYPVTLAGALVRASRDRPDLQAVKSRETAAEQALVLAKSELRPMIAGSAMYGWQNDAFPLQQGWTAAVSISLPVFNGNMTKNKVKEAVANLAAARARTESLRQAVLLDVKQAFLNLQQAEEYIATAEISVRQAQENLDIVIGRYGVGLGSPIEVTDAEILSADARRNHTAALYGYKVSQAALEKAMGTR